MKLEKILKIVIHIVLISVIICIWLPSEVHADWGITGLSGDRSGTTEISVFGNKVVQIIGAAFIFAAYTIANIVYNVAINL